jgi:uncharacterized alpha-E superfamily protein
MTKGHPTNTDKLSTPRAAREPQAAEEDIMPNTLPGIDRYKDAIAQAIAENPHLSAIKSVVEILAREITDLNGHPNDEPQGIVQSVRGLLLSAINVRDAFRESIARQVEFCRAEAARAEMRQKGEL